MAEQTYSIPGYQGSEIAALLQKIDNLGPATDQAAGTMSASDKGKLDGIENGAEENVIESVSLGGTALTPTGKSVNIPIDSTPTTGSNNPVKSGGVAAALATRYTKPTDGIPASDLAPGVLPASGVPGIAEGIADTVSAGTAQNFGYRQSGGDGVNYMKRIKGNTVIWNQVFDSHAAFDRDGIYKDAVSNGGVRIHGTCSGSDGYVNLYNFFNYASESGRQVVSGHKYAILGMFSNASVAFVYLHEAFNNISITADSIVECTQTGSPGSSTYIRVTVANGQSVDFTIHPIVVDLTLLFNGSIPSGFTIDDFKALFPEYGLDYNAGQLAYNDATAIETKGEDNAWTRRIELGLNSFQVKDSQGNITTVTGGLKSTGAVYDEILDGTKYIKRTGVRAHAAGDDSDSSVITDGTNTVYALTDAEEYSLVNTMPNAIMVDPDGTERAIGGHAPFACDSNYSISVKNLLAALTS